MGWGLGSQQNPQEPIPYQAKTKLPTNLEPIGGNLELGMNFVFALA